MNYLNESGLSYLIQKIKALITVKSVNGQTGDVTITTPTKTSDLTNDSNFISSTVVTAFWTGTQAQYDALGSYNATTLYLITE